MRWFVALTLVCAALGGGASRAVDHAGAMKPSVAASADNGASGFKSQPAPEKPVYIGPGAAISGATLTSALVPSAAPTAWRVPSRSVPTSSPALLASRLSPHLRSIPLLI